MFIRAFEGKTILITKAEKLTELHKIKDLKRIVCEKSGIKAEDLRIIFSTKELHTGWDEKTLAELGISEGSNLTIVLRMRGGSNIELRIKLEGGNNEEIKLDIKSN